MRRRCPALLVTALTVGTSGLALDRPALADGSERASLRAELGVEYDSNAQRTEVVDNVINPEIVEIVASPLIRSVLSGQVADVIAAHQSLAASATLGGKQFTDPAARSENVVIAASSVNWRAALTDRLGLGLLGAYYEAFQNSDTGGIGNAARQRGDFRSLAATVRGSRRSGDATDVSLGGGYRLLVFKPNPDYTFAAPTATLDLRWMTDDPDQGVDWELAVGVGYERRAYDGNAQGVGPCPTAPATVCPLVDLFKRRLDHFGSGHLEIARTGAVLVGLGYVLQWNQSNSYGESLQRHFLSLRLAAGLPLGFYLAARGELLLARYADPVVIGTPSTMQPSIPDIDRENRSNVRVDLSRALSARLQLVLRYTAYINELGHSVGRYHRQTALLSLAFTLDK